MIGENAFAVLYTKTKAKDALGSFGSTSSAVIDVRGKFEKFKSEKLTYNGRQEIVADFVFYFNIPAGLFVDESMTTMINGKEYAIAFVENIGETDVYLKIYLRTI